MKKVFAGLALIGTIAALGFFATKGVESPTAPSAPPSVQAGKPAPVPDVPKKLERVNLRLSWVHDLAYGGIYLAKDKGYFAEEGLDVNVQAGGFGLDPIKQVASGADAFGIAGAGNLLIARTQDIPVVAIGAYFQLNGVGYMTRKDSGITTFKQFKGKRIGVQTGSDTDTLYRALLVKNGMTSKDVREVPIQYDMTPFVSGQIDILPGYVTNQPITLDGKGIQTSIVTAQSEGLFFYGSAFITSEKLISENPELVRKFMRGLQKGWSAFFANKDEAVAIAHKWAPEFDAKDLPKIYDAALPLIKGNTPGLEINGMQEDRWLATAKVLEDAGLLKGKVDIGKAYTTRFLK